MSDPIDACGRRARCRPPTGGSRRACTGGASRASMRSLACCSGRWKCGTNRPLPATRSTISGVQSIGSSELIRNVTSRRDRGRARAAGREATVARRQIAAVGPEVHAGEHDLLEAGARHALDLADELADRHASRRAARCRDDAVGAALFTAGLHAHGEGGPARRPRARSARRTAVARRRRRSRRSTRSPPWTSDPGADENRSFSVVAHDADDAGKRGDFVFAARRVAAGRDDPRVGILAGDPADRLARALIGGRRHRAGVDDRPGRRRATAARRRRARADPLPGAASRPGSRGSRR